ncbi:MAG: hypothetical protein A2293_09150 [Elusimicrobia bacterium RIFOXYB2_FULL_49_7]|nr:MAG: hypothetical protein A2293_09150 [Elusimicrobia bacterium RIFOXYB2_FULL_49_7]
MNKKYFVIINVAVSALLLYVLLTQVHLNEIAATVARAQLGLLTLALLISLLFRIVATPLLWREILVSSGISADYKDLFLANAVALPLKFFLPFKISEVTRAAGLKVLSKNGFPVLLGSTLLLRVVAVAATLFLFCFGAVLQGKLLMSAFVLFAVAGFLLVLSKIADHAGTQKGALFSKDLAHCFRKMQGCGFSRILAYSVLFQAGEVICAYLVFLSMGVSMMAADLLYYVPLMMLVSSIPVSVQGVGVREISALYWFAMLPKEIALSFGILQSMVFHIVPAAVAALLWLCDFMMRTVSGSLGKEIME